MATPSFSTIQLHWDDDFDAPSFLVFTTCVPAAAPNVAQYPSDHRGKLAALNEYSTGSMR